MPKQCYAQAIESRPTLWSPLLCYEQLIDAEGSEQVCGKNGPAARAETGRSVDAFGGASGNSIRC